MITFLTIPFRNWQGISGPGTTEKYIKVDSNNERELINRFFPL